MGAKLSIELDRPNHFFTEADVVSGHVVVESDTSLSLQRLTVIRQWRAEGGANPAVGPEGTVVAKSMPVEAGKPARVKFEYLAEATPITHRGPQLSVSWCIDAQAQLDTGEALSDHREYVQIAGERKKHKKGADLMARKSSVGFGFGIFFMGLAVLAFILAVEAGEGTMALAGLVLFGIGIACMYGSYRSGIASMKLGKVRVKFRPPKIAAGETTICTVSFKPKKDAKLNGVSAEFVRQETTITGRKKNRSISVDRQVVGTATFDDCSRQVSAGQNVDLECLVSVPPEASASVGTKRNRVEWMVNVHVDVANWPDYKADFPFVVLGE